VRQREDVSAPVAVRHVHGRPGPRGIGGEPFELRVVRAQQLRGVPPMSHAPDPRATRPPFDAIWAPWRMAYVLEPHGEGCFLCEAVASDDDAKNFVLERRERCISIFNRFPYNNGHLLVAPRAHKGDLGELDEAELAELAALTRDTQQLLARALSPHGFNIGLNLGTCAGAGVPGHLHVHVVPRWNGDTNFMPVVAGTKVIVQSLEALYQVLREHLAR